MMRAKAETLQMALLRIASLEAAFVDLLGRVEVLEQALKFEIDQRVELEKVILKVAGLGQRVDRLELDARSLQRGRVVAFPRAGSEVR